MIHTFTKSITARLYDLTLTKMIPCNIALARRIFMLLVLQTIYTARQARTESGTYVYIYIYLSRSISKFCPLSHGFELTMARNFPSTHPSCQETA